LEGSKPAHFVSTTSHRAPPLSLRRCEKIVFWEEVHTKKRWTVGRRNRPDLGNVFAALVRALDLSLQKQLPLLFFPPFFHFLCRFC